MTMDSYRYEREIRDCLSNDHLGDLSRSMEEDIKRLIALRPLINTRADHISQFISHFYRVEFFYYNAKQGGSFHNSVKDPKSGEFRRDYSSLGDRSGAHYTIRVDHRVTEAGKIIVDEYKEYESLSFSSKQGGEAEEYYNSLIKKYGLISLPREDLLKNNPDIRSPSLIKGSEWPDRARDRPSVWEGRV